MKKVQLIFLFVLLSMIGFGQLTVTAPTITATPGQTVYVPVKLFGAGSTGVPISSANLSIPYDTAKLQFVDIVNFYSGTPVGEWFYSGNYDASVCNSHVVSANWLQSAMSTVAIPDGTALYEIKFIFKGGNNPLNFCIYEFTGAGPNYDLINTTPVSGSLNMAQATLSGPTSVCQGVSGNLYTTEAGQANYVWNVTGGIITAGGTSSSNTATVTWNTAGSKSISVTYTGALQATLPVIVNPLISSISIAASATNVVAGTPVTFTATPVNGGTAPVYQWKVNGSNTGTNSPSFIYTPANGDVVFCLLTPNAPCVSSTFTSNIITMTVTNPVGALVVTLPNKTALPGDVLYYPVKLKGASNSGTPISSANLQIIYDSTILHYDTLVNFYAGMPSGQWFFSGNLNTVAANWMEPSLLALAIPDSTTLFEIKFTYLGGSSTLPFVVNEFTNAAYDFIPTTHVDGSATPPVVATSTAGTILCSGGTTTVTVSAYGGTPPYTGTGDFTRGAGTYSFTVTDANGFTGTTTISVSEPPLFGLKSTAASANGAEISAFDSATKRVFTVAGPAVEYYTLSNTGVLSGLTNMPFGFAPPAGTIAVPNSVAVKNGVVAVSYAIVGANNAQQPGRVAFYNASAAAYISDVTVGYLPDMLAFTANGQKVLTANEGEPNSYGQPTSFDPEGSVSIIDISGGVAAATVTTAGFTSFNGQMASLKAAGVRIYGPGATVAQDLEPEYLTFSSDGSTAFVTLQENNAVAKVNIAAATVTDIYPLGLKDHSLAGNGLDASDRDVNGTSGGGGKINIRNWPIKGMYEPDGIASYTVGADTYYITANEGDSRAYTGFSEEVRVGDAAYVLDPAVFPNAATLKLPANLGRLQLTNATGDANGDGKFEEIQAFGARSFTIWNSSFTKVFDSQGQMEQVTSVRNSAGFNSDGTPATFDTRSDNKGPEPEGIATGTINGVQYAFIGSERTGDLFIYDITNPTAPVLKQYINTPADLGVEGVQFVDAGKSPTGKALVITSSEVSKTVSVYEFIAAPVITLTGNATVEVCQNTLYTDAGATAVDHAGNNITGSIVPTNLVNTSVPGTYTVTYNVTDGCGIAALPVSRTVIVNPSLTAGVSIVVTANPICAGGSVTFTATPVNGGSTPVYQWKKNGSNVGTNSATYSYTPANNDVITCNLTSNASCITGSPATSNAITMQVLPLTSSISVVASANPVNTGTSVTFTATVVNGGLAPSFQWKVNSLNVGLNSATFTYTPANGDVVFCILTPNAPCVSSLFTSNLITMTVNNPAGSLLVTLPNKTAMPGDVIYYPVKLTGAGSNGTPISSANIQITYDSAVLQFDTLVNFHASMPAGQWFFSGNLNTVAANWMEPSILTLAIPDSTTLFEIKFTYLGGNGSLPFTVNEFTNAGYDFIPTNHVNGSVTQLVPTNNTVQNATVSAGNDTCFNALQLVTVAGNGTTFSVQDGGYATFVAGQKISFLPGTTVIAGGYLHGFITLTGQYCNQLPNPVVSSPASAVEITTVPEMEGYQSIRVYPNPTTGIFTVELQGDSKVLMNKAEIYSMSGVKVETVILANERKHEFSVDWLKPGLYFIKVYANDRSEILKIVKL